MTRSISGSGHRHSYGWSVLESVRHDKGGKAASWVPIVGYFVREQKQQMRIRLKALVLDVATGGWKGSRPKSSATTATTARARR